MTSTRTRPARPRPARSSAARSSTARNGGNRNRASRDTVVDLGERRARRSRSGATVSTKRWWILVGCLALMVAGSVAKLAQVQLGSAAQLAARGAGDRTFSQTIPAVRGSILDRDGVDLAVTVPEASVAISRRALTVAGLDDPERLTAVAAAVAGPLGLTERRVAATLRRADSDDDHVEIVSGISVSAAEEARLALAEENLQGIMGIDVAQRRVHPSGDSIRAVVGHLDVDGRPTEMGGIEKTFDAELSGVDGIRVAERSRQGGTIVGSERLQQAAVPGDDVELTIDRVLQAEAEGILAAGVARSGAAGGIAIIGRPATGELLAVAGMEHDDESEEVRPSTSPLAFASSYQAGSVFKLVTAAAAYEHGVVDDTSEFVVPWQLDVTDRNFQDHHQHATERMNVDRIVADSSNVGTIKIGQLVGAERLEQALHDFGFGARTEVGHPAESSGLLPDAAEWTEPDLAAASIGTFQSATTVQLWAAYNVIANRGTYVAPRLVSAVVAPDGSRRPVEAPASRQVVSELSAARVDRALRAVVEGGTAEGLGIPGFTLAAKTGTGRMPSPVRVVPTDDYIWPDRSYHYVTTFAAYFPADRPQVSITVLLFDTPQGSSGAATAGPVFSELARLSIRELGVAPTVAVAPSEDLIRSAPAVTPADDDGGATSSESTDQPAG